MTEQAKWSELGNQLNALALKVKLHFEQTGSTEGRDALKKLGDSVNEAFEAAGNAVQDSAVRSDVREAGRIFADALSATFTQVSKEFKDLVDRRS